MSPWNALARLDIFACVGMRGMLFASDVVAHKVDGQFYPEYHLTEEMVAKARGRSQGISVLNSFL